MESGSHISFFWGLNLEQVPGRAYRKCGEWIALFFFFFGWRSEPGTGALWRVDRTFLFFGGWSEPRAGARPSLQKMWRVDRTFLFFLVSEPGTVVARPSLQKMWREREIGIADFS